MEHRPTPTELLGQMRILARDVLEQGVTADILRTLVEGAARAHAVTATTLEAQHGRAADLVPAPVLNLPPAATSTCGACGSLLETAPDGTLVLRCKETCPGYATAASPSPGADDYVGRVRQAAARAEACRTQALNRNLPDSLRALQDGCAFHTEEAYAAYSDARTALNNLAAGSLRWEYADAEVREAATFVNRARLAYAQIAAMVHHAVVLADRGRTPCHVAGCKLERHHRYRCNRAAIGDVSYERL